jgi:DNA-binding HxlR family transcriptional regulator
MQRTSFSSMNCSIAQTLEIVGEWWSLLIVRDAFRGITRFDDFQARLGISRNILTNRLEHLIECDVLVRERYQEHPARYEYKLTERGRDLWLVLAAMREWGDRWTAPDGPRVPVRHEGCGEVATVVPHCSACGEVLETGALSAPPLASPRPVPEPAAAR